MNSVPKTAFVLLGSSSVANVARDHVTIPRRPLLGQKHKTFDVVRDRILEGTERRRKYNVKTANSNDRARTAQVPGRFLDGTISTVTVMQCTSSAISVERHHFARDSRHHTYIRLCTVRDLVDVKHVANAPRRRDASRGRDFVGRRQRRRLRRDKFARYSNSELVQ